MDSQKLRKLDQVIATFESSNLWRLSLPAKIVLQQALLSLETDHLGLDGYTDPSMRAVLQDKVLSSAEPFLKELASIAESSARKSTMLSEGEKVIGAIFVMQNIKSLTGMISCQCWPQ